ncbi:MAG: MMPL family transporter [Longispora sp.]|nr:MMPL family transporter [Longispora sp. (in: high G+C Gram-positive bacteria)]
MEVQKNEAQSWLPTNAESTQVLEAQAKFASPNTIPAIVVYERSSGLTPADLTNITADVTSFGTIPDLDGKVTGPIPSQDGQAAQIIVPLNLGVDGWARAGEVVDDMRATATEGANGMSVHITGPGGNAADSSKAFEGIDSTLLYSTVAVVVMILLLTYRSPTLWILPVISAGVALTCAQGLIYLLAKNAGLVVNAQSAGILTVLVFGAGTDYALLLVARYREELHRHQDRHEAMAVALHRASPAILASAATVAVGMLCLLLAKTNSTRGLGPVAALGIVVGVCVMLTLLPALLVTVGRWIFWPVRPKLDAAEPSATGFWAGVGKRIAVRPRLTWVATTLALLVMALGIIQLDATGLTNAQSFRGTPDSVTGEAVLAEHFAAGAGSPVVVISNAAQADEVRDVIVATPGIEATSVPEPAVQGETAYLVGTLTDPADSQAGYQTIDLLRERVHAVPQAEALVGGNSAINLDLQRAARDDRNLIIPIVLLVVFVILTLLLRAIVGPLILIATVVLSFAAALGVSALVFRYIFDFGGADTSLPLFVFVFLVALGIDYNIFLMTRVREEALNHGTRRGALVGLAATGAVITSAGFVLAGTFAVLGTLPLIAFAEIGFAVAFGVLLDTIIVRAVLVTALNMDIGRRIWWPSRLGTVEDQPAEVDDVSASVGAAVSGRSSSSG